MKRFIDLMVILFSLPVVIPVCIILCCTIYFRLGRPVFFSQTRPGVSGDPFMMYKFRTMLDTKDSKENLLPDELRITGLGRFLRSTSLDELPELWNVIAGDMSVVGPRPLLMEYLPLYTKEQSRRHEVKPGVTGWAQVNGRNAISWKEKFELDVWYVDNQSFWLDLKILLLTVKKVFAREGISADGHVTIEPFRGNK